MFIDQESYIEESIIGKMNYKIPKVIHYFWFGNNPEPQIVKKCILSWKKYCPDYEIKRWDETNFNVKECAYTNEAYDAKKWAYVSDYARFKVLYTYGGVYLDTDVELIKPIDSIIKNGPFFALETEKYDSVNPGIGMATFANNPFCKKIIQNYDNSHFLNKDGLPILTPVGKRVASFLKEDGLKPMNGVQKVDGITIYPKDYFCPLNYFTGEKKITSNTVAIHHYVASWKDKKEKKYHKIGQFVTRCFGYKTGEITEQIIRIPHAFKEKVSQIGLKDTVMFYHDKYFRRNK
ncbi:glycosyltransferase family 32 protein [Lactobacillus helveticus]|uniref:glycosyltransferase family 32 protein n=1 Tax=Lactobacillus helveticus TaxID=1587 RepID=UPI0030CBD944